MMITDPYAVRVNPHRIKNIRSTIVSCNSLENSFESMNSRAQIHKVRRNFLYDVQHKREKS